MTLISSSFLSVEITFLIDIFGSIVGSFSKLSLKGSTLVAAEFDLMSDSVGSSFSSFLSNFGLIGEESTFALRYVFFGEDTVVPDASFFHYFDQMLWFHFLFYHR